MARIPSAVRRCGPVRGAGDARPGGGGLGHPLPSRRSDRAAPDPVVRRRRRSSCRSRSSESSSSLPCAPRGCSAARLAWIRPKRARLRPRGVRGHPRDADRDRDRRDALSPVRDRPAHQPHDRVGARVGRARPGVRRRPSWASRRSSTASPRVRRWLWPPPRCSRSPCSSPFAAASSTAVDRRFDRARYDGDRTAAAFAERLREQVDLAGLEGRHHRDRRRRAAPELGWCLDPRSRPDERRAIGGRSWSWS